MVKVCMQAHLFAKPSTQLRQLDKSTSPFIIRVDCAHRSYCQAFGSEPNVSDMVHSQESIDGQILFGR
jgi:hypothetical protein